MKRRHFLRDSTALGIGVVGTLAGCGGGGGGAPAPAPTPAPAPAPTPAPVPPVNGPAWWGFGRDPQHSAVSAIATQDFNRIAWSAPVDLAPQYTQSGALLAHYGSPVITTKNTVLLPVKTGAADGFRIDARVGGNGALVWSEASDYSLPAHNWVPSYNITLTPSGRLYAPGAGGKLLMRADADAATGALQPVVFYGADTYAAASAVFNQTVFINTPVTSDAQGNLYFGFAVTGANPAGLVSGFARIDASGAGRWVGATAAADDPMIAKPAMNCAPALSPDGTVLYVAANTAPAPGVRQTGYLLALDATTLAVRARVHLIDPLSGLPANVADNGTSSPSVAADGRVFFGVLESTFGTHNARGWLLQFDPVLAGARVPGGFGWDVTPSIIPAAMVPQYSGTSTYLIAVKYNNYAGIGSGDGSNRLAVLDPNSTQTDTISSMTIMREVITILGPTFASGTSGPVEEWCINTMAADPVTRSIIVNNEDGVLYRWHLPTNSFSQNIRLTAGLGEAYTPTAVGADGAVYAINNATVFSIAA